MKNKWDHEVVNSQEDEDGFSLNPGNVFQYESARGKQDGKSNRDPVNTGTVSTTFDLIDPGTRRRNSALILSTSAQLQSQ